MSKRSAIRRGCARRTGRAPTAARRRGARLPLSPAPSRSSATRSSQAGSDPPSSRSGSSSDQPRRAPPARRCRRSPQAGRVSPAAVPRARAASRRRAPLLVNMGARVEGDPLAATACAWTRSTSPAPSCPKASRRRPPSPGAPRPVPRGARRSRPRHSGRSRRPGARARRAPEGSPADRDRAGSGLEDALALGPHVSLIATLSHVESVRGTD